MEVKAKEAKLVPRRRITINARIPTLTKARSMFKRNNFDTLRLIKIG